MKHHYWFIKTRGSYLPSSWQGWLTYVPYVLYLLAVLSFVIRRGYTFWQSIFILVPNWVAASIVMTWVAKQRSKEKS